MPCRPGGPPLLLLLACVALAGCSVRSLAVRALGNSLAGAGDVFASDEDPELVRDALPFALKTMEALLAQRPDDRNLLLSACSGFTQYSWAFVETDALLAEPEDLGEARRLEDRALKLYLRGRDDCLHALDLERPGIREALETHPEEAVGAFGPDDVELLYWTGASWGAAIGLGLDRPELTVDLPAVRALMERVLELDERFQAGAAHEAMIALDGVPRTMGGSPERAREHFERAVELSAGRRAGPYLSLARSVAIPEQDVETFRDVLRETLAIDPDADPSVRLANLIAQRRARFLLDHVEDYFLDAGEGG
ncbi:MAG: TRAP transporter TatT component family protein [Thermoanaerobaculia bacterium]